MIEFASLRLWSLCLHFCLTTFLIWTRSPAVRVAMTTGQSNSDFTHYENSYLTIIAFGIILLAVQFLMLPFSYNKVTFRAVMALGLDFAACFFIAWMVLDGLSWHTYIYILVFCVAVPTFWELVMVLPVAYARLCQALSSVFRTIYLVGVETFRVISACGSYFFDDCFGDLGDAYERATR